MAKTVIMPKLGLTMTEGMVASWRKKAGDTVKVGDVLCEVSTDKLTNEVTAEEDGVLQIIVAEGETVPVQTVLGVVGAAGEDVSALSGGSAAAGKAPAASEVPAKSKKDVNAIVLGGGPGGYVTAIRLAQNGAKVTVVEKKNLGGTCLNVGCIPTKALYHSAELYHKLHGEAQANGIIINEVSLDWSGVQKRRETVINTLVGGVKALLRANGVKVIEGTGRIVDDHTLEVDSDGMKTQMNYDALVLATGMIPKKIPIPGADLPGVLTSTEVMTLTEKPESLCIIGGGVIGCEFASIYNAFGTKVTVLEALPEICAPLDDDLINAVKARFKKEKIDVYSGCSVQSISEVDGKMQVVFNGTSMVFDYVLMATGRKPATDDIGLENVGIKTERGFIEVDRATMRTVCPSIYAIGDCNGGIQLAHVASAEGTVAADTIMGLEPNVDFKAIPSCVYVMPEVATVGLNERDAKAQGYQVKVGKFPLSGNGKSLIEGDTDGFVKFVTDAATGEILGLHIIGPRATDLIGEAVLAIDLECTVEEIVAAIHSHPTVSEAIQEAAHAVNGSAIHFPPARKK